MICAGRAATCSWMVGGAGLPDEGKALFFVVAAD